MSEHPFERLVGVMRTLLGPDGCPWDREQTPESLKPHLIEEIYEVCESIDRGDADGLREELGDVLMHVVFLSLLAEGKGHFQLPQMIDGIADKLTRRHPHVFGDAEKIDDAAEVLGRWEAIKAQEREEKGGDKSRLSGVPRALPALIRAHRLQEKAAKAGFDWDDDKDVWAKVHEEIEEFRQVVESGDADASCDEFGDLIFALVNVSRRKGFSAENALQRTNQRFHRRFEHIETRAREEGRDLDSMSLAEMDALWEEAKSIQQTIQGGAADSH
jgi:tetrapyrrole methylase family protein/MazG family protein